VNVDIAPLLRLSREERLKIIDQLWESLEAEYANASMSDSQYAELLRRKELYEANPGSGYTLEQVIEFASRDN
jgi:putative addiction module component (TIGR02574 family)